MLVIIPIRCIEDDFLGDLVFGESMTLSFDTVPTSPPLQISNCANISGDLTLDIDPLMFENESELLIPIATFQCSNGDFDHVTVEKADEGVCFVTNQVLTETRLSILVQLAEVCSNAESLRHSVIVAASVFTLYLLASTVLY